MPESPCQPRPRYHPYSLNSHINTNLLNHRRGSPSVVSNVTSYAPSIASTNTSISHPQPRQNNLRIKIDTNVAPSSHIWDEFYKERRRPVKSLGDDEEINDNDRKYEAATPRAITNTLPISNEYADAQTYTGLGLDIGGSLTDDIPITDLLSMFALPPNIATPKSAQNTIQNALSQEAGIGDFPGAEFLDLPDTASTIESQFPGLDTFDFGQFDFSSFIQPSLTSNEQNSISQANISETNLEFSPLNDSAVLIGLGTARGDDTDNTSTLNQQENNKNSIFLDSDKCTYLESNKPAISSKSPTYLQNIKMRSIPSDKDVIQFQKKVSGIAAKFYTSLADLFENTPNETIKLGMSRNAMIVDNETIPGVLEDIKSLCSRLTAKAADIPGYPADVKDMLASSADSPQSGPLSMSSLVTINDKPRHSIQKGSLAEPIDLTAATPRSPRSNGSTPTPTLDRPRDPLPAVQPQNSPHFTPRRQVLASSPRSNIAFKRFHDPFTPESMGTGPLSVQPTTSPMDTTDTPAYTPASNANVAIPAPSRVLLDLPPLSSTSTRVIHGPWKLCEVERLRTLVAFSQDVEDNAPIDHIDWTWVVDNFGGTRNRHQVLIKAVELGLRETSTHYSRRIKQKGYRDAVVAMESDLQDTVRDPPKSPLPPLLTSARITPNRKDSFTSSNLMPFRGESEAPIDDGTPVPTGAGQPAKASATPANTGRRESITSRSSPSLTTQKSPRILPRGLDLTSPTHTVSTRISTSPIRGPASSTSSPFAPKSRLNTMGFKPYAHPTAPVGPSTAPPKMYPRHALHSRSYSGFSLFTMPGNEKEWMRPSVISPTFGGFGMKGYQLAPLFAENQDDGPLSDDKR
ncbi:uncharacterized protein I206_107566 [Kwoniella pini CBS 10737]|uniref:Uncharacterized protein n=1 Tax=Kwoniella pini CBS 10737 TaxID=1296096 RepID=A0A1B9HXN4_9TREE|nr:uncharacterized protein I206_05899 [Kwoniella pini CBS 10737]OCF48032.1 hypothetical protein I206_05899 [Kwoniella pini CBS 10737]